MEHLLAVLRHLISYGPARNDTEREHLLGLVDAAEAAARPAEPAEPAGPAPQTPAQPPFQAAPGQPAEGNGQS